MPHSITLPSGYTKKDLFLAAIAVQLEKYSLNDSSEEQNTNNNRIFESPAIEYVESTGGLKLSAAEHHSDRVNIFEEYIKKAAVMPAWVAVQNQYPFQNVEQKKLAAGAAMPTKLQLANYLTSLVVLFKELMLELKDKLEKNYPLSFDANLILGLVVSFKKMLMPEDLVLDKFPQIYTLFSQLESKVFVSHYMKSMPEDSVESCCNAIMSQISLIITPPMGSEVAYGGMLGDSKNNTVINLLDSDYGTEKYKQFNFPEHYDIPSSCFDLQEKEEDRVLWQFLYLNVEFLKQVDPSQCHPSLYQASLQRLWNAFVQHDQCPQWIKEKSDELHTKIHALPTSILILFDGLDERIKQCDKTNSNSLQELLITLIKETLLTLSKSPDISTKKNTLELLGNLMGVYAKGKTFYDKLYYTIINRACSVASNMESAEIHGLNEIEVACNNCSALRDILSFFEVEIKNIAQPSSGLGEGEKINLFNMLVSLEGAVPTKYFAQAMPQPIHEALLTYAKENKDEELLSVVEARLPKSTEAMVESLENIKQKINEIKNTKIQQAMLDILKSQMSIVGKLNCIGAVAKGKCDRDKIWLESHTRRLYGKLSHFYGVNEGNLNEALEKFKESVLPTMITSRGFFSSRSNSPETTPSTSPSASPVKGLFEISA